MNAIQNISYNVNHFNVLGQGAYGTVFTCTSPQFPNEELCVKKILKSRVGVMYTQENEVISRETQILKQLQYFQNIHLVKVHDIYEEDNFINIVMELCKEGELSKIIKERKINNKKVTTTETLDLIYQICDGYSVIYENYIIHRDIKPQNILVQKSQNGLVYKIADLGAARIIENMLDKHDYTAFGTYMYASPQIINGKQYSSKTDVYSFGILLYQYIFLQFPCENKIKDLCRFQMELQKIPFKVDLNIEGTLEEKQEIKEILEQTIVYEEENRIDWESLIKRVKKSDLYARFRQDNEDDLQLSLIKTQKQQITTSQVLLKKELYKPAKIRIVQNNPISQYLKIQLMKKQIAQKAIDNFIYSIQTSQFFIPLLEFYCYITSIQAYQFNLLKNMKAIYENNYKEVNSQVQQQITAKDFTTLVDEFLKNMSNEDNQIKQDFSNSFQNCNSFFNFQQITIESIKKLKIRPIKLVEFKENLESFNKNSDYKLYWDWIEYFYNQYLCKILRFSPQELYLKKDCTILYFAYVIMLNQIELQYPQLDLRQFEKADAFPEINLSRDKAIEMIFLKQK